VAEDKTADRWTDFKPHGGLTSHPFGRPNPEESPPEDPVLTRPRIPVRDMSEQTSYVKDWLKGSANWAGRNVAKIPELVWHAPDLLPGSVGRFFKGTIPTVTTPTASLAAVSQATRKAIQKNMPADAKYIFEIEDLKGTGERLMHATQGAWDDPETAKAIKKAINDHYKEDAIVGAAAAALAFGTPVVKGVTAATLAARAAFKHGPRIAKAAAKKAMGWGFPKFDLDIRDYHTKLVPDVPPKHLSRGMRPLREHPGTRKLTHIGDLPAGSLQGDPLTKIPIRDLPRIIREQSGRGPRSRSQIAQTFKNRAIQKFLNLIQLMPTPGGLKEVENSAEMWKTALGRVKREATDQNTGIGPDDFEYGVPYLQVIKKLGKSLQRDLDTGLGVLKGEASRLFDISRKHIKASGWADEQLKPERMEDLFDYGREVEKLGGKAVPAVEKLEPYKGAVNLPVEMPHPGMKAWTEDDLELMTESNPGIRLILKNGRMWSEAADKPVHNYEITWMELDIIRRQLGRMDYLNKEGHRFHQMVTAKQEALLGDFKRMSYKKGDTAAANEVTFTERYFKKAREDFAAVMEVERGVAVTKAAKVNPFADDGMGFATTILGTDVDPGHLRMVHKAYMKIDPTGMEWDRVKGLWWWNMFGAAKGGTEAGSAKVSFESLMKAWRNLKGDVKSQHLLFGGPKGTRDAEELMAYLESVQKSGARQPGLEGGSYGVAALGTFSRMGALAMTALVFGEHSSQVAPVLAIPVLMTALARGLSTPGAVRLYAEGTRAMLLHAEGVRTPMVMQSLAKMGIHLSSFMEEDVGELIGGEYGALWGTMPEAAEMDKLNAEAAEMDRLKAKMPTLNY
jgi:hypothetical protein